MTNRMFGRLPRSVMQTPARSRSLMSMSSTEILYRGHAFAYSRGDSVVTSRCEERLRGVAGQVFVRIAAPSGGRHIRPVDESGRGTSMVSLPTMADAVRHYDRGDRAAARAACERILASGSEDND